MQLKNWFRLYLVILLVLGFIKYSQAGELIHCNYRHDLNSFATGNVLKQKTIHKEFRKDGLKYVVHIENTSKFDKVEDYISMENDKSHKITYSLECK